MERILRRNSTNCALFMVKSHDGNCWTNAAMALVVSRVTFHSILTVLSITLTCLNGYDQGDMTSILSSVFQMESLHGLDASLISDGNASLLRGCLQAFSSCREMKHTDNILKELNKSSSNQLGNHAVFASFMYKESVLTFLTQLELFYEETSWTDWSPYFFVLLHVTASIPGNEEEVSLKRKVNFPISSDVYVINLRFQPDGSPVVESLTEVYALKGNDITQEIELGASGKVNFYWHILSKVKRRSNFKRIDIIGIHVDNPVYKYSIHYKENSSKVEFSGGFVVHEYWFLRDALNFTEVAAKWPTYLRQAPNGSLTGLAIPINHGLADICIGANEFLEYRSLAPNGITYLQPTFHNNLVIFFKQPHASAARDIYLAAFSAEIWLFVGLTWLFVSTSLALSILIIRRTCSSRYQDEEDAEILGQSRIWALGAMCQKGWHVTPSSGSSRLIFLIGLLSGFILYTAYCASLVSILSVDSIPIRKLEDLVTYRFKIFSDDHIPTTNLVVKYLQSNGKIPKEPPEDRNLDLSTNVTRLVKSNMAAVSVTDSFYQAVKREFDDRFTCATFYPMSFSRRSILSSMFVKRGSPLREYFNYKIITMRESGIMFRLRRNYIERTGVYCLKSDTEFDQRLSPTDVITAFGLLAGGFAISGTLFALEKLAALKMTSSHRIEAKGHFSQWGTLVSTR